MQSSFDAQLLAAIAAQTQTLREILAHLQQPKLGFGEAPALCRIYANRSNGCNWYTVKDGEAQPIEHASVTSYVTELKFEKVTRRGKETAKLHVCLQGDRPYCIESGHDSHFSKCILSAISVTPKALLQSQPLTIAPQAGDDESVLFARVYIAGNQVVAPYSEQTDWRSVALAAKEAIG